MTKALRKEKRSLLYVLLDDQTTTSDCRRFIRKMPEDLGIDCIDIAKCALAKWGNERHEQIKTGDFIPNVRNVVNVN
jgi:hypothetical protein